MAKITAIMTDLNKVANGVWVPYAEGIELCIAGQNNEAYKKKRNLLMKPHLKQSRAKALTADDVLDIIKPAVAEHLLVGWRNIEDETGNPIPYSTEKALEFFKNPALSDLYNFVLETAGESDIFKRELLEDAEGNS